MKPEEFAEKMREAARTTNTEWAHQAADDLMCELLRSLGYEEGVKVFEEMEKWYA